MITIYCLDISEIHTDTYQKFYSIVSEERKAKADKFHFPDDSKRCVFGEILLRYALFQFLGYTPRLCIDYNQYGKSHLKYLKGFFYNLSHSGRWVVFAYGSSEIGVDVEKIVYDRDNEGITDRFFSPAEKQFICSAANKRTRARRFTQTWTLKESYIKYLGTGLSTSLDSFSTSTADGLVRDSENNIDRYARLNSYLLDDDYYLSICSRDDTAAILTVTAVELLNIFDSLVSREEKD